MWQTSMRHVALILIWNSHFQGTVEKTGAKRSMFEVSTARNGKKKCQWKFSHHTDSSFSNINILKRRSQLQYSHSKTMLIAQKPMHFKFLLVKFVLLSLQYTTQAGK